MTSVLEVPFVIDFSVGHRQSYGQTEPDKTLYKQMIRCNINADQLSKLYQETADRVEISITYDKIHHTWLLTHPRPGGAVYPGNAIDKHTAIRLSKYGINFEDFDNISTADTYIVCTPKDVVRLYMQMAALAYRPLVWHFADDIPVIKIGGRQCVELTDNF